MTQTVLVVEDNDVVRSLCTEFLNLDGYRTICVASAGEALAALDALKNDGGPLPIVALIDQGLPDMQGTELAAALSPIPVIMMSGNPMVPAADEGWVFIKKPFDLSDLRALVRQAAH